MKTKLLPFSIVFTGLTLMGFISNTNSLIDDQKFESFEGEIEFKIEFFQKSTHLDQEIYDYWKQKYGSKMIVKMRKNGDYLRIYPEAGDRGIEFYIYTTTNNMLFSKWKHMDTVFYYPVTDKLFSLIKRRESKIDDLEEIAYFSMDSLHNQPFTVKYKYDGTPFINPLPFDEYEDMYFGDFVRSSKCFYKVLFIETTDYKITFTRVKYEQKEIDKSELKIPKELPRKYY